MLEPKEIAVAVTKALDEKKGMDIKLLKIDRVSSLADYFLICTGTSNTHVKTLCDYAEYTLEQLGETMLGFRPLRQGQIHLFDGFRPLRRVKYIYLTVSAVFLRYLCVPRYTPPLL